MFSCTVVLRDVAAATLVLLAALPARSDEYCGQSYAAGDVLTCGCCASHDHGQDVEDIMTRFEEAFLLSGGQKISASADDDDVELYTWELGGNTPTTGCESDVATCYCEDERTGWSELVPMCTRGQECNPKMITEEVSYLKKSGEKKARELGDQEPETEFPPCAGSDNTNVLFGRSLCEHASSDQCEDFFVRSSGGAYHLCKLETPTLQCPALFQKEEKVKSAAAEVREWAVQHLYEYNFKKTMKRIDGMNEEALRKMDMEIWKKLSLEVCSYRLGKNMSIGTNFDCEKNKDNQQIMYLGTKLRSGAGGLKNLWLSLLVAVSVIPSLLAV